jgi:catechol-2,3-dioxygenase
MIEIKRIGHVGIQVPNIEHVAAFYENIVGLEISDHVDGSIFLRCNEQHHCL